MANKKTTISRKAKKRKTTKKANRKADLSGSYDKIKTTAKNVNRQITETATYVAEDLSKNSVRMQEQAAKQMVDTLSEMSATLTVDNFKRAAKSVNDYSLKTADDMVDGALVNGEKWQAVAHKAVKGSLKLAAKQQDIVFDTLETIKGQLINNAGRFRKMFK